MNRKQMRAEATREIKEEVQKENRMAWAQRHLILCHKEGLHKKRKHKLCSKCI